MTKTLLFLASFVCPQFAHAGFCIREDYPYGFTRDTIADCLSESKSRPGTLVSYSVAIGEKSFTLVLLNGEVVPSK